MAITKNLLLWGCKSQSLTKSALTKLESFHHSAIHRILQITWSEVRDHHAKNKIIRRSFNNITTAAHQLCKQQPTFIRKIISNKLSFPSKKSLPPVSPEKDAWVAPHITTSKSLIINLQRVIPHTKPNGDLSSGINFAHYPPSGNTS